MTTAAPPPAPLDERLFLGAVLAGFLIIGVVTAIAVGRVRRAQADEQIWGIAAPAAGSPAASSPVPVRRLIDFTLTDRTGRTVTRADLQGRLLVVNFVFTGCSLTCEQVNRRMGEIQRLVAGQPDVLLVSLTVDPASDTPETLARFARRWDADTNRWLFLTGQTRSLYPLLEESFLGPGQRQVNGGMPGGFAHTDRIAVVDARGELRAMVNGLKSGTPEAVVDILRRLRAE